jgi:ABC-type polysaccharide/polyol phosphate transport system ATPase subunit
MNLESAIHFENVSKRFVYDVDEARSIFETVTSTLSRKKRSVRELWAVKDASFKVLPGQSLGIIGRNGSGKSTVLKLASGIIQPSSGRVIVRGRLSALLELGAGFHADLTGRENIYLNASILGMSRDDVDKCYDEIVDFSELSEFIHMPVKHYSSGMYMRLGFSVAVHLDPDILIIDEILAVGDQSFQNKCIDRIYHLKRKGTTIVFVSHNLNTIRNLCSDLIWMDKGQLMVVAPTNEVISQYQQHLFQDDLEASPSEANVGQFKHWGSREIEISRVRFMNGLGEEADTFELGQEFTVEISYSAHQNISEPEFGLAIFRQDGVQITGPNNRLDGFPIREVSGTGTIRYHLEKLPLLPGTYNVTVAIHDSRLPKAYDFHEEAYSFRVISTGSFSLQGVVELPATWEHESIGVRKQKDLPQPAP